MYRLIFTACLCVMLAAGCVPMMPAPEPTVAPSPQPVTTQPALRATSVPAATRTPATAAPVMSGSATPAPTPRPPLVDWGIYEAALRPATVQRLASELRPGGRLAGMTQYSLTVTLPSDVSRVDGAALVRYTNREAVPLNEVYFHLFPNIWDGGMTVSDVRVAGQPVDAVLESSDDLLRVPLRQPLQPGQSVDIAMDFRVPVPMDTDVGNYGDFAYVDDVLAMAHFYPTVVVYDDDGWHLETPATQGDVIYHDASLYDVSLTAPADLTLAATGSPLTRIANPDGTATWRLVGGPMRDFNVAASKRYQSASRKTGDVTVTSYFLPEQAAGGQKALNWASQALQTYETMFGPYPYAELDVVQTATTAGGIEYPGMVVIASRLYDDKNRSEFFESATVHEVAHQWWYNVVGNDQVNDPWLDEALTQYSTYFHYDQAYGKPGAQGFLDGLRARWSRVNYDEKPIGLPVSEYQDQEYSAIVYGRGPLFLFALRDRIGADKMAELLRRYYAEYSWKIATPDEFRRLAEEVSGQDIGDLWAKWVKP
ncbi:MAG: M1 family metallopeptidase [Anaerolineae bacterium]|nr:M1 family metallopeptidase [Anaerolineae bacterium]